MSDVHHICLIPGFFGFANLGRLRYFLHVHEFLATHSAARGVPAEIHVVKTRPTSSLPLRAARLADTVARTLPSRRGVAHLIGHSTGGLDARLFATPGVSLSTRTDVERYADRVRSVITIATPHFGTPLASALASMRGQRLLALLSLGTSYVLRFGHLPMSALLQFAEAFRLAGYGRPHTQALLLQWNQRQAHPLSEREIESVVYSAYARSYPYTYGCHDQVIRSFCPYAGRLSDCSDYRTGHPRSERSV